MWKFNSRRLANEQAATVGEMIGMSVFDGKFYVGTREQLEKIGCVGIAPACDHNEMVERDDPGFAWQCAKCGYVYGKTVEGGA